MSNFLNHGFVFAVYIVFFVTSEDYTLVKRTTVLFWNRRTTSLYCYDNKHVRTCFAASLLSDSRRLIVFHIVKACIGQPESSRDVASARSNRVSWLAAIFFVECVPDSDADAHWRSGGDVSAPVACITFLPLRVSTRSSSYWTTRVIGVGITACCRSARRVISRTRWISTFARFERVFFLLWQH